ncbi:MAG: SLOG family protein [Peptostreptococcaceae bacterium]
MKLNKEKVCVLSGQSIDEMKYTMKSSNLKEVLKLKRSLFFLINKRGIDTFLITPNGGHGLDFVKLMQEIKKECLLDLRIILTLPYSKFINKFNSELANEYSALLEEVEVINVDEIKEYEVSGSTPGVFLFEKFNKLNNFLIDNSSNFLFALNKSSKKGLATNLLEQVKDSKDIDFCAVTSDMMVGTAKSRILPQKSLEIECTIQALTAYYEGLNINVYKDWLLYLNFSEIKQINDSLKNKTFKRSDWFEFNHEINRFELIKLKKASL